jgi:hypothetical protein
MSRLIAKTGFGIGFGIVIGLLVFWTPKLGAYGMKLTHDSTTEMAIPIENQQDEAEREKFYSNLESLVNLDPQTESSERTPSSENNYNPGTLRANQGADQ